MAITIPIISEFSDKGIVGAQAAFNNFKTKIGEADGAMNKFKAGGTAALDAVKANAGTMALAAGGAIAGFALKAIGDFQDLALEVDHFSDVTGIAAEEASKWVEVTGDVGIEAGVVESAINRMNKEIGKGTEEFEKLGIEVVKTADGAVDTNETFLNTIEVLKNIKDPTQRATVAAELLGKGWTGMAELIEMGSDTLRSSLDSVSDAKIIDEEEIDKAKRFRDTQDQLKGAFEDVSLAVGEFLIPALTNGANAVTKLTDAIGPLLSVAGKFTGELDLWDVTAVGFVKNAGEKLWGWIKGTEDDTEELGKTTGKALAEWIYYESGIMDVIEASRKLTAELEDVDEALSELKGNVDERTAWRNLQDEFDNVLEAAIEAFTKGTPQAIRESEQALDDLRVELGEYIAKTDAIPTDKKTTFLAEIPTADIDRLNAIFNELSRTRTVTFIPTVSGMPVMPGDTPSESTGRRIAAPAPIRIPRPDISGARSVVVNVAGSVVSERDLVETVRKGLVNSQRNGNGLVYSNQ
jgi:hypothetical protein